MAQISGTAKTDKLTGTDGADQIVDLLGGDDRMYGGAGDDLLRIDRSFRFRPEDHVRLSGGSGADELQVTGPVDENLGALLMSARLSGGDGDDEISAYGAGFARMDGGGDRDEIVAGDVALARINGGAGDDFLLAYNVQRAVIAGGEGNDFLVIQAAAGRTIADMGAGDDFVVVQASVADDRTVLTLGAGRDTIFLEPDEGAGVAHATSIVIHDFETGVARDRFDAGAFLRAAGIVTADPLAAGHFRLVQNGGDVDLRLDRDAGGTAYGWETLVRFEATDAASFVPYNLGAPVSSMLPPSDAFVADVAALTL